MLQSNYFLAQDMIDDMNQSIKQHGYDVNDFSSTEKDLTKYPANAAITDEMLFEVVITRNSTAISKTYIVQDPKFPIEFIQDLSKGYYN